MPQAKQTQVDVQRVRKDVVPVYIVGESPMICNRMSEKAQRDLLLPPPRKTAADKQANAKHDPLAEYQSSVYRFMSNQAPTLIAQKATAFKGAMATAALDLPEVSRTQIGRLVYVEGDMVPIYGVPKIFSAVTRSADINKTPDIRTRAIIPQWACKFEVSFVSLLIRKESVYNLISAGGITAGVGDWRPQKGKGDYGQWRLCNEDDPVYQEIVATGGYQAQLEALEHPQPYDVETSDLLSWFGVEAKRRGFSTLTGDAAAG